MTGEFPPTLPGLLLRNAERFGARPAMREKDRGIWQTWTWRQSLEQVRHFALGLAALGFQRGDRLSVIGDNRPRLYWAMLAAQALGGVAVPVYQDSIARELAYVWDHAEVGVIVAEDQEQVDKVLALREALPALRAVIYDDPRGLGAYRYPWLHAFAAVQERGRAFGRAHPGYFETEVAKGDAEDVALICYTSGTTGPPKGAMLTHRNAIATAESAARAERLRPTDEWLAYLPMAWVGDAFYTLVMSLYVGFTVNCPESPETVTRDLRELGPTVLLAPPRIWESMLTSVEVRAADATPLKRRVFAHFRAVAERVEALRAEGRPVGLGLRLQRALGELLVYGPVRDQLGLGRTRVALTGGAPLGPDTFRFFRAFGVNLKQIYGSTEVTALVALQPDGEADPGTVGRPCPGIEVRIGERGEVLVRSPGVFRGYLKAEEATREVVDADGWFHTGDAGFFDARGHLVIIDRARDVGALADGTPFAPQFIENKLKYSPYVREAVAFGHGRPFVAAMIAIDLGTVGHWAERRGLAYAGYTDLALKDEVRALLAAEVERLNRTLPAPLRVRRFVLLPKDLDPDDAEITRTRKLRRRHIADKYAAVIDALYGGRDAVELATTVTYEDGRQGVLQCRVRVQDVGAPEAAPAAEAARG